MQENEHTSEIVELTNEEKLQLENLQLKIRICELTQALASAEKHIYELELKQLAL